ncbi:MAG: HAD hydrolase-like protein [Thermodesulfobacteriota bacterium]|nr:HAD hydrolase-like protein [Thermodesulfobacteriota bacterium]
MDLLIFDMDGVLIDVSGSYRKTIAQSIHIYFKECLGIKSKTISNEDISLFKTAGGFNNDWDLTSGFLLYLFSLSGLPPCPKRKIFEDVKEAISFLKRKSSEFSPPATKPPQKNHLLDFLEKVKDLGGGLEGVRHALKYLWEGWVYGTGDLERENLVKRIFQEVYLGEMFASYYHLPRLFYKEDGLYRQERLLIPRRILSSLRKKMRLGIASGRPRFEAELALKRFRIFPYFDSVVTLDECEKEEARLLKVSKKKAKLTKPHPYSLLKAIEEIGLLNPRCGYVGDVVDDMRAAQAAKKFFSMLAIGFLQSGKTEPVMMEALLRAGADCIIKNPKELLHLAG